MKLKNQNHKHSAYYHLPKQRQERSASSSVEKIILAIICLASLAVVAMLILALVFSNENQVKHDIEQLARDYYENYIYDTMVNSEQFAKIGDLDKVMQKYQVHGFTPVTLKQMLTHFKKDEKFKQKITKYCDDGRTTIQFFPTPPFDVKSYDIVYKYSCDFDDQ